MEVAFITARNDCLIDEGDATNTPCVNGYCVDGNNTFFCRCFAGWTGTLCDIRGLCVHNLIGSHCLESIHKLFLNVIVDIYRLLSILQKLSLVMIDVCVYVCFCVLHTLY